MSRTASAPGVGLLHLAAALALALLAPGVLAASGAEETGSQTLLAVGHLGAVPAMECDAARSLLFTAGEDGMLRVWDFGGGLAAEVGLGILPPISIAVNPVRPEVAVLQGDGAQRFAVTVWDWEQGSLVWQAPLEQEPLFMRWSGGGTWLMLGEPQWQSLRLIGADGRDASFHPEGFGIVGFAEASRSERTLLTYLTVGRLVYWDVASGSIQRDIRTTAHLADMRISEDRRYAAGTDGTEVVVIDLVTGAAKSRIAAADVRSLDLASAGDQVACLTPGAAGLRRWLLIPSAAPAASRLPPAVPVALADPQPPEQLSVVRLAPGSLFAAGSGGSIFRLSDGQWQPIARSALAGPTGISAAAGTLAIGSPGWIWLFRVSSTRAGEQAPAAPVVVPNPLDGPIGLSPLGDLLVAWRRAEGTPTAVVIDPATGAVVRRLEELPAPLMELKQFESAAGLELLTLDQSGRVRIVDPADGRSIYESWLPGTLRVAWLGGTTLVAGRTPLGSEGPLLRVDTATGEQVTVPSRSRVVYDLLSDPSRGLLYTIGVSGGSTALLRYRGPGLTDETMLTLLDAEDLGAELALDRETGMLYSSLAAGRPPSGEGPAGAASSGERPAAGVAGWTPDNQQEMLDGAGHVPRKLAADAGLVAAVNRDGSVSLWEAAAPGTPAELSLLGSGGWCLVFPDGRFAASDDATALVRVVAGGRPAGYGAGLRIPVQ